MATPTRSNDGFGWLTLEDGEEVIWTGGPHKNSFVAWFAIGLLLSIFLVGLVIMAQAYLSYKNTRYVVTTHGIYRKKGAFSKDVKQINFDKVQNISFNQDVIGSTLGYGNVLISTAGGSGVELQFKAVPDPQRIQELISNRIEEHTESDTSGSDVDVTLEDVVYELRVIRQCLSKQQPSNNSSDTASAEQRE